MGELDRFDSEFKQIIDDNRSGSVKVLNNLINWLDQLARSGIDYRQFAEYSRQKLELACLTHRDLVVICSFRDEFETSLQQSVSTERIAQWVDGYRRAWEQVSGHIADRLLRVENLADKDIVLHSHSHTVVKVLQTIKERGHSFRVVQSESRPAFEGRQQARELQAAGIEVRLATDFGLTGMLREMDVVLLGADQFSRSAFVNKTGSYAIALMAGAFQIPLYVLADSRKEVDSFAGLSHSPSGEVWPDCPEGIGLINRYFEEIPLSVVTRLITEAP